MLCSQFQSPSSGHFDSYPGFFVAMNQGYLHYSTTFLMLVPRLRTSGTEHVNSCKTRHDELHAASTNRSYTHCITLDLRRSQFANGIRNRSHSFTNAAICSNER